MNSLVVAARRFLTAILHNTRIEQLAALVRTAAAGIQSALRTGPG